MKKVLITEDALKECVKNNMTQIEMAHFFNCSKTLVRIRLREYGIPSKNRRTNPPLPKDLLIEENHVNRLTLKQISKKYGRTYATIKNMFKDFEISPKDNTIFQNQLRRQELFKQYDVTSLYGQLTKIEIQKKLGVGQEYLDQQLQDIPKPFINQSSYERELKDYIISCLPDLTSSPT